MNIKIVSLLVVLFSLTGCAASLGGGARAATPSDEAKEAVAQCQSASEGDADRLATCLASLYEGERQITASLQKAARGHKSETVKPNPAVDGLIPEAQASKGQPGPDLAALLATGDYRVETQYTSDRNHVCVPGPWNVHLVNDEIADGDLAELVDDQNLLVNCGRPGTRLFIQEVQMNNGTVMPARLVPAGSIGYYYVDPKSRAIERFAVRLYATGGPRPIFRKEISFPMPVKFPSSGWGLDGYPLRVGPNSG